MDPDRLAARVRRRLGLPGRSWSPSPRTSRLALWGLAVMATVLVATGGSLPATLAADWPAVLAMAAIALWAVLYAIPLRLEGVRTWVVLDAGVLVLALADLGPGPGLAVWVIISLTIELLLNHFVALALVNSGISALAAVPCAVVAWVWTGGVRLAEGHDPVAALWIAVLIGVMHSAMGALVLQVAVRSVAEEHTWTWRWRDEAMLLGIGALTGGMAGLCVSSETPLDSVMGLTVPLVLVISLTHTLAGRRSDTARDGRLITALQQLARADTLAQVDDVVLDTARRLSRTAIAAVDEDGPTRDRRHRWWPLGDEHGRPRWLRATLRDHELHLPPDEEEALATLAAVARAATDRVRTQADMAWRADHDPLTGLLNRNGFWHAHVAPDTEGVDPQAEHAMLLLDLDGFKTVNDRYGHARGDDLLQAIAPALVEAAPPGAGVARWGGDEFVIRVDGHWGGDALDALGRRLIAAVERAAADVVTGGTVSASVGHATWHGEHSLDVLQRADASMYAAKRAGKATVRGA